MLPQLQLLAQADNAGIEHIQLFFTFFRQHLGFGQTCIQFRLLGTHARIAIGLVDHAAFGAVVLGFGQLHFRHFVSGGADCLGLHDGLFGQTHLFTGCRIGCAPGHGQNGHCREKRSNTH